MGENREIILPLGFCIFLCAFYHDMIKKWEFINDWDRNERCLDNQRSLFCFELKCKKKAPYASIRLFNTAVANINIYNAFALPKAYFLCTDLFIWQFMWPTLYLFSWFIEDIGRNYMLILPHYIFNFLHYSHLT